jgi:hypothetical protein
MSKELLERAEALAEQVEEMSRDLVAEYEKWVEVVRTNGLERKHGVHWQTTFELPISPFIVEWKPDTSDTRDLTFVEDVDIFYFMPKTWLKDPEAWLQGALAAHGQFVADEQARKAQWRVDRAAVLRKQLEELEAQG